MEAPDLIVKVQKPIASNDPSNPYLVYTEGKESQSLVYPGDSPELDEAMKDSYKRFFYADPASDGAEHFKIFTDRPCPSQDW